MAIMNVSLPDLMKPWVEERACAIALLQAAITEGIAGDTPKPFDVEGFKVRMRAAYADELTKRIRLF